MIQLLLNVLDPIVPFVNKIDSQASYGSKFRKCQKCKNTKICQQCSDDDEDTCTLCYDNFKIDDQDGFGLVEPIQGSICYKCFDDQCIECDYLMDCKLCPQKYDIVSTIIISDPIIVTANICQAIHYPDCASCDIDPVDLTSISCQSCINGYYDQSLGCLSKCPIGFFGVAQYSKRGFIETSSCQICNSSCEECVSNQYCSSCPRNYYLEKFSYSKSYGYCKLKELNYITTTLYVTNDDITVDVQNLDGSEALPFGDLEDAIERAYEIAAPYKHALITIYLKESANYGKNHYLLRNARDFYQSKVEDKQSQGLTLIIKPATTVDGKITVYNKRRDQFQINVSGGLTIENIIFDSLDSVIPYDLDSSGCLGKKIQCCQNINGVMKNMTLSPCLDKNNDHLIKLYVVNNLINSIIVVMTVLTRLENRLSNLIYQRNHYYRIHRLQISRYFSNCGSIIRNFKDEFSNSQYLETSEQIYVKRMNKLQNEVFKRQKLIKGTSPYTCSTNCFKIEIYNTIFDQFNFNRTLHKNGIMVIKDSSLRYKGVILNLIQFNGPIHLEKIQISNIQQPYQTCSVSKQYYDGKSPEFTDDFISINYPGYYNQLQNLISVVNHTDQFILVDSQFYNNTAVKGLVYLQFLKEASGKPQLITNNIFKNNAGYFSTVGIFIRMLSSENIYELTPQQKQQCSGFKVSNNYFEHNYGCPEYGGAIVRFECITTSKIDSFFDLDLIEVNDEISIRTDSQFIYNDTLKESLRETVFNFDEYIPTFNSVILLDSFKTISIEMNTVDFSHNYFYENFGSYESGLLDIRGLRVILLRNNTFVKNGESTYDLIESFNSKLIKNDIDEEGLYQKALLPQSTKHYGFLSGLIKIQHNSHLLLKDLYFDNNWIGFSRSSLIQNGLSQLLYLQHFYGSIQIQNMTIMNQNGLQSDACLAIYQAIDNQQQYGGGLPPLIYMDYGNSLIKSLKINTLILKDSDFGQIQDSQAIFFEQNKQILEFNYLQSQEIYSFY
ncbi:UNKNOWN [Stylonychia lemnae]|uniref:Uncharacterized protein n=1 Tax=Stylonychia lemnae TaxID=5949 RepID=A0A078AC16_STYLE|nr:UNKNOWN [Stylonychia lemnae]|eukprot:CDW79376.1 UNKNOWN [Stylonychia lemnae]